MNYQRVTTDDQIKGGLWNERNKRVFKEYGTA